MKYLILPAMAIIFATGCARQAGKARPATIEDWMKVPAEQRLADSEYIKILIENMRNDPVLYRAVEIEMDKKIEAKR